MRERLIELINKSNVSFCNFPDENYVEKCKGNLADYLLANGVIVPPCKVGDTVYLFYPVRKGIYEAFVDEISLYKKSNFIVARDLYFNRRQTVFFEQFGKTVFLTKEEAENALKERKETK